MRVLQKNEVLAILRSHKPLFSEQYGVTDLGVFGSVARDEAHPDSDVDIVVRMREPKLFFMVHIKDALEEVFQRPVDIIQYRETMNPFLKKRIDRDAVYVRCFNRHRRKDAAGDSGLSRCEKQMPYLSQIESGKRVGSTDVLASLARGLARSLDDLVVA